MFSSCALLVASSLVLGQEALPSNYEHLKEMECFTGDWISEGELPDGGKFVLTGSVKWTLNRNFQAANFDIKLNDRVVLTLKEIRGWDPAAKQIKVWSFNSAGGHGQGVLSKEGKTWILKASGVEPSGEKRSSTATVTFADKDSHTIEIKVEGGEPMKLDLKRKKKKSAK